MNISRFLFPKDGCNPSECEDGLSVNIEQLRFCVTDGASESFDSRGWARKLSALWKLNVAEVIESPEQFYRKVSWIAQRWLDKWRQKELPWYAEEKLKKGAFAAFIGLEMELNAGVLRWRALAVGDSCLIEQTKDNDILSSFPLSSPEQFDNYPELISTNTIGQLELQPNIKWVAGICESNCVFLLMSDAISRWYLCIAQSDKEKQTLFIHLLAHKDREGLKRLIDSERESQSLRNDDIAIIYIAHDPL